MKSQMTKEELLNVPHRDYNSEELTDVRAIYIIPTNSIHDSGYQCIDMVAAIGEEFDKYVKFGDGTDAVHITNMKDIVIDVNPKNGCVRLLANRPKRFRVLTPDCSSVFIEAE